MTASNGNKPTKTQRSSADEEALDYIFDMIEQLALIADQHGAKELASDLRVVRSEAEAQARQYKQ